MVSEWSENTPYSPGTLVTFQGTTYRVVQAHTSQSDWIPSVVPALFSVANTTASSSSPPTIQNVNPSPIQFPVPHPHQDTPIPELNPPSESSPLPSVTQSHVAAPTTAQRPSVPTLPVPSSKESWLHDAQDRTASFHSQGPRSPATWLLQSGNSLPANAVSTDSSKNDRFIARTFIEGHLVIGKVEPRNLHEAMFAYDGQAITTKDYEILVGDMYGLRWVETSGPLDVSSLGGSRPVDAGMKRDGKPIAIAVANHGGQIIPGNAGDGICGAVLAVHGTEIVVDTYRVLCFA